MPIFANFSDILCDMRLTGSNFAFRSIYVPANAGNLLEFTCLRVILILRQDIERIPDLRSQLPVFSRFATKRPMSVLTPAIRNEYVGILSF